MYCGHCGKEVSDDAKFCNGCGKQVQATVKSPTPARAPKKHSGLKVIFGVFVALVVLLGAMAVLGLMVDATMTDEERAARDAKRAEEKAAEEAQEQQERMEAEIRRQELATRTNKPLAYRMSQDFVKRRLKTPATADFPSIVWEGESVNVDVVGPQEYVVRSYVDAQNSFGAQMRTHYVARLRQESKNNWRLLSLEMDE